MNGYYEKKGSEITKYYLAGASRVAMRKYTIPQSMTVEYILGDHLGSTSITTDSNGAKVSEMRYKPWGEVRFHWVDEDLTTDPSYKLPVYTFTGQRSYMDDPSTSGVEGFGLMDYNARMYDPAIGRFVSADLIVPRGIQGLDRYSYVGNNPLRYTDPSGHDPAGTMCDKGYDDQNDCGNYVAAVIGLHEQGFIDEKGQWTVTEQELLAWLLSNEFNPGQLDTPGAPQVEATIKAMTRRYGQFCSGGLFTTSCISWYVGYFQGIVNLDTPTHVLMQMQAI